MHTDLFAVAQELGIPQSLIAARGLTVCAEARDLELAEVGTDGKEHLLVPAAAQAWRSMVAAADADGVVLFIVSAFRSVERQAEIVRRKLAAGLSIEAILAVNAPPGFSEHHTGRAIDLSTPGVALLEREFEQTAAFDWLTLRGAEFGFKMSFAAGNPQGYGYEPWHWCFHADQVVHPPLRASISRRVVA